MPRGMARADLEESQGVAKEPQHLDVQSRHRTGAERPVDCSLRRLGRCATSRSLRTEARTRSTGPECPRQTRGDVVVPAAARPGAIPTVVTLLGLVNVPLFDPAAL